MGWWASHQNIGWMDWVIRYPLDYYNHLSTCVAKKRVLWKRKISRCGFCPFFTFEIIQYMLSANLVLWIFSSLCSDKDCHTWQHEMIARWEQLEEPFHPNFSNWSFAFLDFYKVWKWHILLLCTNFDATDEIKCNLFESFKGNLFLDFVTRGLFDFVGILPLP